MQIVKSKCLPVRFAATHVVVLAAEQADVRGGADGEQGGQHQPHGAMGGHRSRAHLRPRRTAANCRAARAWPSSFPPKNPHRIKPRNEPEFVRRGRLSFRPRAAAKLVPAAKTGGRTASGRGSAGAAPTVVECFRRPPARLGIWRNPGNRWVAVGVQVRGLMPPGPAESSAAQRADYQSAGSSARNEHNKHWFVTHFLIRFRPGGGTNKPIT